MRRTKRTTEGERLHTWSGQELSASETPTSDMRAHSHSAVCHGSSGTTRPDYATTGPGVSLGPLAELIAAAGPDLTPARDAYAAELAREIRPLIGAWRQYPDAEPTHPRLVRADADAGEILRLLEDHRGAALELALLLLERLARLDHDDDLGWALLWWDWQARYPMPVHGTQQQLTDDIHAAREELKRAAFFGREAA